MGFRWKCKIYQNICNNLFAFYGKTSRILKLVLKLLLIYKSEFRAKLKKLINDLLREQILRGVFQKLCGQYSRRYGISGWRRRASHHHHWLHTLRGTLTDSLLYCLLVPLNGRVCVSERLAQVLQHYVRALGFVSIALTVQQIEIRPQVMSVYISVIDIEWHIFALRWEQDISGYRNL